MAPSSLLIVLPLLTVLDLSTSHPTVNERRQAQLQPILGTAQQTPELSTFYSFFASTGGQSGVPGPALGERFDDPSNQYTLLAPANNAFASISPAFLEALTSVPAYELLLTLLLNYVLPQRLNLDEMTPKTGLEAVGGFMFDIESDGSIQTNEGVTQSAVPIRKQANIVFDQNGRPLTVPASNGIIYIIDKMLDPLITYFGEDAPGQALPPISRQPGTMADILRQHPRLTSLSPLLEQIDPDFVNRLSLYSTDRGVNERTVYLAPSDAAFRVLPSSIAESATSPSNHGANTLLLEFGLGEYVEGSPFVRSGLGFNITIDMGRANNARVQERVCADNGCVWLVGRWLDPLFGAFS
ncbi:hypothetical protein M409DRAFT_29694 [Zasmidium cellare ATCC 36951]|uniref:FAS1 domain-containing protein n=1 Tax=Zasmidium cellare ATCC 36951 TaxID=1080233 RepID=A0A6A6BYV3_ZASCE|nr:uncharacterized protein M409DRAFT_29694 [Zasmidium cellare ATCC 36951]KAF2159885.1 hypothetical protein M409DRAFT_29694 [Zasmidium cellare ATCC 36951]